MNVGVTYEILKLGSKQKNPERKKKLEKDKYLMFRSNKLIVLQEPKDATLGKLIFLNASESSFRTFKLWPQSRTTTQIISYRTIIRRTGY